MRNFKIVLQYEGTRYKGWQKQGKGEGDSSSSASPENTIQGKLERLLSRIAGKPVEIQGSGRTDAGVHAYGQVANFHMDTDDTPEALMEKINSYLPEDIGASLSQSAQDTWNTIELDGIPCYTYSATLPPTGWTLVSVVPYTDIYSVGRALRNEMIGIMAAVAGAAYAVALYLSNHMLRRIWQLSETMQKVEDGDVEVRFNSEGKDEIGQLILHFDHMMGRIQQLMEEKIRYGFEIKNLELKALQAQINPHFLYNTLDTINCMAIQKAVPEIAGVATSLATFYKISLSRGKDRIPVRDEVLHAKMYLRIQNARFENRIQTRWDISPEIENLYIIKIVLQPIIENAAIHGIYEREDGTGTITVHGYRKGEDVYIEVADDGIGMPQEKADTVFSSPPGEIAREPGGYGVKNIIDRLKIAYGYEYGLSCKSVPGAGTVVTIHIPAVIEISNE